MKIAFFSEVREPQLNGVVVTLSRLTKHLQSRGHEVLSVVPRIGATDSSGETVELRSIPFPLYPEMRVVLPHWSFHRREFEAITAFNPDLIHVWTPGVLAFFAQKWASRIGRPLVASYETDMIGYLDYYGFGAFAPIAWRYFEWLHNHCRRTYAPSPATKRFLEDHGIHDVEVFDRGVDLATFNPQKRSAEVRMKYGVGPEGVLILYIGRMSKEKNLTSLLEIFTALSNSYQSIRLVMTGEGPLHHKLAAKFRHPKIAFTGPKRGEDLAALFASADIFAIPSLTETLSLVAMEAMASGVPVLGMKAGGICDVVTDRETGMLANSRQHFENSLRLLIENPQCRTVLGANARKISEKRTWAGAFDRLERSYQQLMQEEQVFAS